MNNPEIERTLFELAKIDEKQQSEFFEKMKDVISPEEKQALLIGIGYFRLLMFPKLNRAIKESIAKQMYEEFNRKDF